MLEHPMPRYERIRTSFSHERQRLFINAPVYFEKSLRAQLIQFLPHLLHFRDRLGHELLPREAGIDAEHQHQIRVAQHRFDL